MGHRRIARAFVERWFSQRHGHASTVAVATPMVLAEAPKLCTPQGVDRKDPAGEKHQRVLLIEDSVHYQTLIKLLMAHDFPQVDLHVADDGFVGLAMTGELQPDVLIVDILLPGIDGASLIARLRSHPQFQRSRLIVVTSLDEGQRESYAFALTGLPVVHKPRVVQELPAILSRCLSPVV